MADLHQSSLYEPTAPQENLLRRVIQKKKAKIAGEQNRSDKKQVSASTSTPSRPGLPPFLEYFAQRRKTNNNNNNNKCSHEHLSKASGPQDSGSHSPAPKSSAKFRIFRSKHKSDSPVGQSPSEKEASRPQDQVDDGEVSGNLTTEVKSETEVLCHGLLTKPNSLGQERLLSHPASEADLSVESEAHKNRSNELGCRLEALGKSGGEIQSNETSTFEKFLNSSELQEQMNSINLKRCKDAVMPHSVYSSVTLPAHSESLSIPPVIEETEEGNADEPHVIEVFLPQREPPSKEPPTGVFEPSSCDSPGKPGSTKKRNKLRHILRHLLTMNGRFRKEDKQWLVEEEEEDDEEEQVMTETNVDGEGVEPDQKCAASGTPSAQDDTEAVTPEKKRRPGTKVMSC